LFATVFAYYKVTALDDNLLQRLVKLQLNVTLSNQRFHFASVGKVDNTKLTIDTRTMDSSHKCEGCETETKRTSAKF
jgi:hypothetical protein